MNSSQPQNYIITGAAGTLGTHVTRQLAERGDKLFLIGRSKPRLEELRATLPATADVFIFEGDLVNPEVAQSAVSTAVAHMGKLHGLLHLVGGFAPPGLCSKTPFSYYNTVLQGNFLTAVSITQPLLAFLAQDAHLIYLSSFLAHDPIQGMGAYAASKAALVAWVKTLAREIRPQARANVVSTIMLDTPMARMRVKGKAVDYLIDPGELAHVVTGLLATEMRHINGAVIPVYGNFALENTAF
jgi:3-oxoacyl-[acyl-carrier protein] reductase